MPWRHPERGLWLLCVVAIAVWATALLGPFQFDDENVIVRYAPVQTWSAWWQSQPSIRPLLKLSYLVNWQLSPQAWGFHLTNLLLHALNSALFYACLRVGFARSVALTVVLLWAMHPAQTEAVTYIAGRSVLFSTTFLLVGCYVLLKHTQHLSLKLSVCLLAGLTIRETSWIFLAAWTLLAYIIGQSQQQIRRWLLPLLGINIVVFSIFYLLTPYAYLLTVSLHTRSFSAQLLSQIAAYHYLITNTLIGLTPNIDPDITLLSPLKSIIMASALLLTILVMSYLTWQKKYLCSAGIVWFFLLLLPTNSFFPRLDIANDRHLYPALLGLAVSVGVALRQQAKLQTITWLLVLLLSLATLVRNEDYHSARQLWTRTAQQSPHKSRVWNNLGMACWRAQEPLCAEHAFQQALRLDPNDSKAAVNYYFMQQHHAAPALP